MDDADGGRRAGEDPDPTEQPSVLVVDDEPHVAKGYALWLDDYETHIATGGEEALEMLAELSVDVVLLDRLMPDVSGDEVLVTMRDWGLDARVAMVTAVTPGTDILDMGFDGYVQKPVDAATIRETVEGLLDSRSIESTRIELGGLRVKRNVLELERSETELAADPTYADICDRIDRLEERLEERRTMAASGATDRD